MTKQFTAAVESPIGIVRVTAVERGITDIVFVEESVAPSGDAPAFLLDCISQLREYFDGKRSEFHSLPLVLTGTDFQQKVWDVTERIPYGETITYGDIGKELKLNGGGQAVGSAMGRNPVCIIVPCHRVLPRASSGEIGGYAGGTWRKKWLLELERKAKL